MFADIPHQEAESFSHVLRARIPVFARSVAGPRIGAAVLVLLLTQTSSFLLRLIDLAVNIAAFHQLLGCHGRHMTVIQHDDLVGVADGTDPLSDNDLGGAGDPPGRPADFGIGGGVHGAGAVVQDENLRLLQDGTGDAEPLFLATGDVDAALAQVSFQSLGIRLMNSSAQAA